MAHASRLGQKTEQRWKQWPKFSLLGVIDWEIIIWYLRTIMNYRKFKGLAKTKTKHNLNALRTLLKHLRSIRASNTKPFIEAFKFVSAKISWSLSPFLGKTKLLDNIFLEKSTILSLLEFLGSLCLKIYALLGRLDGMGPGCVSAAGRRRRAAEQERLWARERRADALAAKQGFNCLRRGFAKLD